MRYPKELWFPIMEAEGLIEQTFEWRQWATRIPFIKFPADWEVQVIPPFGGALARFRVKLPFGVERSVYLDGYGRLGAVDQPYWEIYPINDATERFDMNDIDGLLAALGKEDDPL